MPNSGRYYYRMVLLLAAEQGVRAQLKESLERLGCVVTAFASEAEALIWAQDEVAELAIVDSLSGTGFGVALASQLRHEGVPVMFFDGFDPRSGTLSAEPPAVPGLSRHLPLPELLDAYLA
ncbi:MAG: hypothetical protein PGN34_22100 [Methylobacterium frigidaeris]